MVEIMVGVLVGLIGCVIIFQMYAVADARKRTVASGSDMDISGRLGLMTLERDLQLAGYGFGAAAALGAGALLGCNVTAYDKDRGDFNFTFAPLVIQDGAGGGPDTLISLRGSSSFAVAPKPIDESTAITTHVKADTGGRAGVLPGDVVIATKLTGGLACAMFEITGVGNADQLTLDHATGDYLNAAVPPETRTARYNKVGGVGFALVDEGTLYNLGAAPVRNIWSVQNNKLVVSNDIVWSGATPIEAADLIVNLQAQYGVDADNNGMISAGEWTNANPADWRQLLAVRFALLARSTQYEQSKVTTTVPRWSAGVFTMLNLDGGTDSDPGTGSGDVNNWRNYRYNVFEAVVPLRNTIVGRAL